MRIASYNILDGAPDTYPLLVNFVKRLDLDILCLQEANDWHQGNPSRLETFAKETGLPHFVFGDSNTQCKLVIFARFPIMNQHVYTDGLWHCAIQATVLTGTRAIDIWNVHLNPFDEDKRLEEARFITRHARNALIIGDMNSLSRADNYPPDMIEDLAERGNKRYGEKALRFDVTDYYARQGFIDAAAALGANAKSVPTQGIIDALLPDSVRLDYMFIPPTLVADVREVKVVKDQYTDKISDHYPLVMTI